MEVWFIGSDDFPDVNCVDFEVKHVNLREDKTNQGVTLLVFPARITAVKRSFPTWGIYLQYSNFAFFSSKGPHKKPNDSYLFESKNLQKNFQSAHIKACESQSFAKHQYVTIKISVNIAE